MTVVGKNNFISSVWEFDPGDELSIHEAIRWYGKLPQKLVRKLISLYSQKQDLIMANFAGSGTVISEANITGRHSLGSDTHPLSLLVNRVKINQYTPQKIKPFLTDLQNKHFEKNPTLFTNQEKWFDSKTLSHLHGIITEINKINETKKYDFYALSLSNIIRNVSRVDSRCINHIMIDKKKKQLDVLDEFSKSVYRLEQIIKDYQKITTNSKMSVINSDARSLNIPDDTVDFMISHPPYTNAVLYYNIYSLSSHILGFNYSSIREIDLSSGNFTGYLNNMGTVLKESHRVIKPNGYEALIIGDTRKDGDILTSLPHMIETGNNIGFKLKDIFIWRLKQKAGMSVLRRGNHIDHNYILIFQKK